MANEKTGREMLLAINTSSTNTPAYTNIGSIKDLSWSMTSGGADATTRADLANVDDPVYQKNLTTTESLSLTLSGIFTSDAADVKLFETMIGKTKVHDFQITIPGEAVASGSTYGTITGQFRVADYGHDGNLDGAHSYSCTLENHGKYTFARTA